MTLTLGDMITLTAIVLPKDATDKTVRWTAFDDNVFLISNNGKGQAIGCGETTVMVQAGNKNDLIHIRVGEKVSGIKLDKTTISIKVGETATLTPTIIPENATAIGVIWSSDNKDIATVLDGVVTGIQPGSTTIMAITEDGSFSAKCKVTVLSDVIAVESISLNAYSLSLTEGQSLTLTATVLPNNATNKTVSWSSSNSSVASVENNGLVRAIAEGSATITASAGGKSATCSVTVAKNIIPVTEVKLNKSSLELIEGESTTLVATVLPDNATYKEVSWSSSNTAVASVDRNGLVTAIAEGTTTIIANADGTMSVCIVVVTRNNPGGGQEDTDEEDWDE